MNWIIFCAGFLTGGFLIAIWTALLFLRSQRFRSRVREVVDLRDGIEFRPMPDRGLNERIYKPNDGTTTLSQSVVMRRRRPEKRSG